MNRTDRLLAIVLELQARLRQRAEDLAATFETSKRTIYRDIQALCEAGVPVVAVPGQGYSLVEGYFLPPLTFTTDEATILLLGSDFLAQTFDSQYRAAAQSASRKIEAVLPARLRGEVEHLQNSMRFIALNGGIEGGNPALLRQLRQAIIEERTLRFHYHTRYRSDAQGTPAWREVDPYGLIHYGSAWYLSGYCHLRRGIRHFRLERMDSLETLDRTFTRPERFQLRPYEREAERSYLVRAVFDREVARWVREAPSYFAVTEEAIPEGLLVTLRARQEEEVVQWLLGWGAHVRVLEPDSLRQRLAAEAAGMLWNYST